MEKLLLKLQTLEQACSQAIEADNEALVREIDARVNLLWEELFAIPAQDGSERERLISFLLERIAPCSNTNGFTERCKRKILNELLNETHSKDCLPEQQKSRLEASSVPSG